MLDTVLSVKNLSKRYRIGSYQKADTLAGQIKNTLLYPIRNLKRISQLSRFKDTEDSTVFWALQNINFEVKRGDVLGIIGHNGAGKSTLLKILSRITEPTAGEITIKGRVSALLEVGTGFHPELTGRDNVYLNGTILGMTKKEIDNKFDEILDFAGVEKHIDTPVKFYSSGMKVRLGFSVAAHLEPDILIIDEVLAVGDADFQKRCLGKMNQVSQSGKTVLFVSHDMASIKHLCPTSILLENGKISQIGMSDKVVGDYLSSAVSEMDMKMLIQNLDTARRNTGLGDIIKFKKCSILNYENNPVRKLLYGEPFSIYFQLSSKIQNSELEIMVGINTLVGERIASGVKIIKTPNKESLEVRVHIKNLKLNPGSYTIVLGIRKQDQVEDAFRFEVTNNTFNKVEPYKGNKGYIGLNLELSEYNL